MLWCICFLAKFVYSTKPKIVKIVFIQSKIFRILNNSMNKKMGRNPEESALKIIYIELTLFYSLISGILPGVHGAPNWLSSFSKAGIFSSAIFFSRSAIGGKISFMMAYCSFAVPVTLVVEP